MMRKWMVIATATCLMSTILGCTIGYKKTLFFTKTNVGLDIDSEPPTMELTFSRREAVVSPTFENGQTPPVLAGFSFHVTGPLEFSTRISSAFAGGDTAVTMATLFDATDKEADAKYPAKDKPFDSTLYLNKAPSYKALFGLRKEKLLEPGEIEPFIFATDTSFGLKVAWSGATAQFPDTIKFGYNRKEFALAPVTIRKDANAKFPYQVRMPSFLATVDNSAELRLASKGDVKHIQYFATGKAADAMARHYGVRKAMFFRLDPRAAQETFGRSLRGEHKIGAFAQLRAMHLEICEMADPDATVSKHIRAEAALHCKALNDLSGLVPDTYEFTYYEPDADGSAYVPAPDGTRGGAVEGTGFPRVTTYLSRLEETVLVLGKMVRTDESKLAELEDVIALRHNYSDVMAGKAAITDAIGFYCNLLGGR